MRTDYTELVNKLKRMIEESHIIDLTRTLSDYDTEILLELKAFKKVDAEEDKNDKTLVEYIEAELEKRSNKREEKMDSHIRWMAYISLFISAVSLIAGFLQH